MLGTSRVQGWSRLPTERLSLVESPRVKERGRLLGERLLMVESPRVKGQGRLLGARLMIVKSPKVKGQGRLLGEILPMIASPRTRGHLKASYWETFNGIHHKVGPRQASGWETSNSRKPQGPNMKILPIFAYVTWLWFYHVIKVQFLIGSETSDGRKFQNQGSGQASGWKTFDGRKSPEQGSGHSS